MILGLMQGFWYRGDRRRERFVAICADPDVQRLTWESYLNKAPRPHRSAGPYTGLLQGSGAYGAPCGVMGETGPKGQCLQPG